MRNPQIGDIPPELRKRLGEELQSAEKAFVAERANFQGVSDLARCDSYGYAVDDARELQRHYLPDDDKSLWDFLEATRNYDVGVELLSEEVFLDLLELAGIRPMSEYFRPPYYGTVDSLEPQVVIRKMAKDLGGLSKLADQEFVQAHYCCLLDFTDDEGHAFYDVYVPAAATVVKVDVKFVRKTTVDCKVTYSMRDIMELGIGVRSVSARFPKDKSRTPDEVSYLAWLGRQAKRITVTAKLADCSDSAYGGGFKTSELALTPYGQSQSVAHYTVL